MNGQPRSAGWSGNQGQRLAVREFLGDGQWTAGRKVLAAVAAQMNPGVAVRSFRQAPRLRERGFDEDDIVYRAQLSLARKIISSMVKPGLLEIRGPEGQLRYDQDGVELRLPFGGEPLVSLPVLAQWVGRSSSWAANLAADSEKCPPCVRRGAVVEVRLSDVPKWAAYSARARSFHGRLQTEYAAVTLRWMPFDWETDALFNRNEEDWERGDDGRLITRRAPCRRGDPPTRYGDRGLPLAGVVFGSASAAVDDGDVFAPLEPVP